MNSRAQCSMLLFSTSAFANCAVRMHPLSFSISVARRRSNETYNPYKHCYSFEVRLAECVLIFYIFFFEILSGVCCFFVVHIRFVYLFRYFLYSQFYFYFYFFYFYYSHLFVWTCESNARCAKHYLRIPYCIVYTENSVCERTVFSLPSSMNYSP